MTNEAAERLHGWLIDNAHGNGTDTLLGALATERLLERQATVERIRAAMDGQTLKGGTHVAYRAMLAILDEEAAR